MLYDSFPLTVAKNDSPVWIFKRNFNILCIWKGRSNRHNLEESFKWPPFQSSVSPTFLQQIMLPWLSRTHTMSGFLSFVQNVYPKIEVLIPKDIAISSGESSNQVSVYSFCTFFLVLRHWAWKGTSILHSPWGRCLSISVPLNACGEVAHLWG